ncbi:MAG: NADPH:quinone oxidoreductase family protein [Defluviicoccus sp.]|nr:NADPH:quinone oxidoreductase family protein [Defluviicoccus sp.]MDE0278446.1 NADPH:quinone oxidoreductase family protein [Defluviicoccus sp.]
MRAIVAHAIGSPEDLKIDEMPDPAPGPGEVLVDIKTAAVNFPDLLVIEGKYQIVPPHPFVPGKEGAGTVAALGEGVDGLSVGDRVMVQVEWGTYAEKLVLPADHCFPMPDGMGFEEAAAMGIAYQTAHFALVARAGVKAGDRVLVTAATGSVGIAALQLARAFGCTVLAGVTTMSKADVARENGADHIVDLTVENLRDSIRNQVKEACGAVDVVLESVGGEVFDGAVRALDFEGRAVIVGFTGGEIASFRTNYALLKVISVTGVNWAAYRDRDPEWVQRVQRELFDLHGEGRIAIPVQAVLPMADYVKAFDVIRDRRVRGKVILRMA